MNRCTAAAHAAWLAFACLPTFSIAHAGMVREAVLGPVPFSCDGADVATFAVQPLPNSAKTDVCVAWTEDGLSVNADGKGEFSLTVISDGGVARKAKGRLGEKTLIPWRDLTADERPFSGAVKAIWEFSWADISKADFEAIGGKYATPLRNTSMSVLCAEPQFRVQPHLQNNGQWGEMVFGKISRREAEVRSVSDGFVVDFASLAVPNGKCAVDGGLDEWKDAEFSRFALLPCALGGRYSGEVAARFDGDALYLAVRMSGGADSPRNTAFFESRAGFSGGDAFQIRMADNDGHSESFCAWFDSSTGKPAFTCDNRMLPADAVLAAGGALAFGKLPGGYAMEMKLPWAAAGMKPPRAGERRRATFQPWWGPVGREVSVVTELSLAARPVQSLALDLPRDGRLAAGIFAADGSLVRQLCVGRFLPKGRAKFSWDGRDQTGNVVPSGDYTLRGVLTDELQEKYRFSIMNPGTPPWPTADGTGDWLSDEAPPQGAATDGDLIFLATPGCEKGTTVLALDRNDRRVWGYSTGCGFFPRCVSLSCADGKLYVLFSGPKNSTGKKTPYDGKNAIGRAVVMCFEAKTGKLAGFSARSPRVELPDTWPYVERASGMWNLAKEKKFSPATYIGQPRYFSADVGEPDNAIGLAALDGVLAVSKFFENRIDFYDCETLEKRGSVVVEAPAGLCRIGGNAFLAVSGKNVVRVEVAAKNAKIAKIVSSELVAPVALTTDAEGNIYVSDWAGEMCVKRFSAGGEFLGIVGKRGGRAWIGKFENGGMLLPHGLAVRDGSLYVAEADMVPKRVSKWNVATGSFTRDWIGPRAYAGGDWLWLDPDDDSVVHVGGVSVRVDWESGAWRVLSTDFRRMDDAEPFTQNGAGAMSSGVRILRRGGKLFVALSQYRGKTVFYRKEGDRFVPCAAIGSFTAAMSRDGSAIGVFDSDIGRHLYMGLNPGWMKGHPVSNWIWNDLNGDGLASADEVQFATAAAHRANPKAGEVPLWFAEWGRVPGPDGTLALSAHTADEIIYSRLSPRRWSEYGPVFDIADEQVFLREKRTGQDGVSGAYVDDAGNFYYCGRYSGTRDAGVPYAARSFAPDGSPRWTAATPKARDALSLSLSNFCGEWNVPGVGKVLGGWNWWWTLRPYLVTDDGLVLATAFEETNDGPRAIWGESHQFFVERGGRRYIVNGGNQQAHFVELLGLDNAVRIESPFSVTEDDVRRAAADTSAEGAAPAAPKDVIFVPWGEMRPVALDGGKGRAARIGLSRDATNLYVSADVDDSTPMLQNGEDWQTLFLSGDCVDVMLAGDDAKRRSPRECVAGDRRLLFSIFGGNPVAVLYEPVTEPRSKSPVQMMATSIDSVRRMESAKVTIRRREDRTGYALEAAVPLAELGAIPSRGDVGVIFSGAIGGRELRLYHYNGDTGMIDDLTTEATLQPHEWGPLVVASAPSLFTGPWRETRKSGAAQADVSAPGRLRVVAPKGATRKAPAHVSAERPFAVKGGTEIDTRFLFRATGLQGGSESRKKAGLGYAEAHLALVFYNKSGKTCGRIPIAKFADDRLDWREVRGIYGSAPKTLVTPKDAVRGIVSLKFSCCEPTLAPELVIDGMDVIDRFSSAVPRIGTASGFNDSVYDYKSDAFFQGRPIVKEMAKEGLELRLYNGPHGTPWMKSLKQFNAIWLMIEQEHSIPYDPDDVGRALKEYVEAGGGLVIDQTAGRYPNSSVDAFWDKACSHLGMTRFHEEVVDFTNLWVATKHNWMFYTTNIVRHPVTDGVPGLWFPCRGNTDTWGSVAIGYPEPWQVVVRGEANAKSYPKHPGLNRIQYDRQGHYSGNAPLVAVRQLGKGRIVSIAIAKDNSGWMFNVDKWPNINERGEHDGKKSDFVRLHANAMKWVSEPSLADPSFGADFKPVEPPPLAYSPPEYIDSSSVAMSYPPRPIVSVPAATGVVGLHSSHSDGKSTVAEYATAAKSLGLNYIVFTDPLDKLSEDGLTALRRDCEAVSDEKFYACPGVEYVDRMDIPWAVFHDKIEYPVGKASRGFELFDGERVLQRGRYGFMNNYRGAVLSKASFDRTGAEWCNQHWFNALVPYVHESGHMVEDNFSQYLSQSKFLHRCQVVSFTRVRSADELAWAKDAAVTCARSLADVRKIFAAKGGRVLDVAEAGNQFVRYGGDIAILQFATTHVPGTNILRIDLALSSSDGLSEIAVHDDDRRVIARFDGGGATTFSRTFDFLFDRQSHLLLVAKDRKGHQVCSSPRFCSHYHAGVMRCLDNMNLLSFRPAMMNQLHWDGDCVESFKKVFLPAPHFHMSEAYGWEELQVPSHLPRATPWNYWIPVALKGVDFPGNGHSASGRTSFALDAPNVVAIVDQSIGDCRTVASRSDVNSMFSSGCVLAKDGENPYWRHRRRVYQFVDRIDTYWYYAHKQLNPGYRGGYAITEGEIEFLKDATLASPVQLFKLTAANPGGEVRGYRSVAGNSFGVGSHAALVSNPNEWYGVFGLGENAEVSAVIDMEKGAHRLRVLVGKADRAYAAGTRLKYRFAVGTFVDDPEDSAFLVRFASMMDGSGFPVEMKRGALSGVDGLVEISADRYAAEAKLGPAKFIQDYPVRIKGLADNGCAMATNGKAWKPLAMENGRAYVECALEDGDTWWFGNLFVADDPAVRFSNVPSMPGHPKATVEIFNPSDREIAATILDVRQNKSFKMSLPPKSMTVRDCD